MSDEPLAIGYLPLAMRRVANAFAGLSTDGVPAAGDQHRDVRRGRWLVQAEAFGRGKLRLYQL